MSKMIEIENLHFAYPSDEEGRLPVDVLRGVNMSVGSGEFVAIIGHNGSGKSTLAKMFNGVLRPSEGRVLVDGMDTADDGLLLKIRQRVGMVFQNPDNQIVATIVEEDVAFGPENLGLPRDELRARVDYALRAVDMSEYKSAAPHRLSGGQKQRVAIAGVLAMKPRCIVMDEPTAMLDPSGRREVISTVTRLCRDEGITVILITHYMNEAVDCDRVIVMSDGQIVDEGPPRDVFSKVDELRALGLEVPQATRLAHELKKLGLTMPPGVLDVESCVESIIMALAPEHRGKAR